MKGFEIVKAWNESKKKNRSLGTEDNPSGLVRKIDQLISQLGEEVVSNYFTELMINDDISSDIDNHAYYHLIAAYKKKTEEEKKQADAIRDSSVVGILGQELVKLMGTELANKTEGIIRERLDAYVSDKVLCKVVQLGDLPKVKMDEIVHQKFEEILKFVAMDEPVMLVGPAGTGKNVIASQVAKALGLEFYFSNAITQEYKLTGFVDAMGNYQKTQFYDAFTKGGLFLLDEMDASIPEALIILNCAIANRYFDFPKIGRVQAHKDFRVIACANTYGTGASTEYVGRNQLDGASLNRFALVKVDYDPRIEEFAAHGNKDVLDFCREFRRVADMNGAHIIVSYRDISRLAKMIDGAHLDVTSAIQSCVIKGLEKDTLRMLCDSMRDVAFKKYVKELINY
jgi:DNA polymerase III delta prime subunit